MVGPRLVQAHAWRAANLTCHRATTITRFWMTVPRVLYPHAYCDCSVRFERLPRCRATIHYLPGRGRGYNAALPSAATLIRSTPVT